MLEGVVLVGVLGIALSRAQHRLNRIAATLAMLGSGLGSVEHQLRRLRPGVAGINAALASIAAVIPAIAAKAELVARR
ncbi:MAG: hypothetical protein H0T43_04775 [Solirubrobacterales bacterium]|nr:hypothetical protein [Solirubrobacterales bacterium]